MQILVTGMHRSGTTLCFDLIRRHRNIHFSINEGVLFDRDTGTLVDPPFPSNQLETSSAHPGARAGQRSWVDVPGDTHDATWVSKMPYPGPLILQEWCSPAVDYVSAWLDEFGEAARVVHMVRHPFAVCDSVRRRWGADPVHLTNYGPISFEAVCRDWAIAVGGIDRAFCDDKRMLTLHYEELVKNPTGQLARIFGHCRLPADESLVDTLLQQDIVFFGKINDTRAYAHREVKAEPISRSTSWLMTPLFRKWDYSDR